MIIRDILDRGKMASARGRKAAAIPVTISAFVVVLGLVVPGIAVEAVGITKPISARTEFRRPAAIPYPEDDPYSEAKAKLGRVLFFDPRLSASRTRSCATCHNPSLSWGDGLPRAIGEAHTPLAFRTPTLLNVAWVEVPGWYGKFNDLESVAFTPLTSPKIMNMPEKTLIATLQSIPAYRRLFADAFPGGAITRRHVELALATFERTIVSGPAPFDRWVEGDENAIGAAAKRGFALFRGKAGCAECHSGWSFTDHSFHDIGTAKGDDIGRAKLFPTSTKLRYAFRTPTLRDVARRAPYMHNGSEPTLKAVIELYNRGGIDRPSRSERIKPLHLTAGEKADLIAFLKTLTSDPAPVEVPVLPR